MTREVVFIRDWKPEPVKWIWPGWLARGKLTILAGNAGTGKSTLTQAIGAIVTTGGVWPDGVGASPRRAEQGYFMCWEGEDDLRDTTGPRFMACGGNREFYLPIGPRVDGRKDTFTKDHIPILKEAAKEFGSKLSVLSISPLVALRQSNGQDENANVRKDLEGLVSLAEELNIAVLGIHHLSKGTQGQDPLERLTGSLAYGAISRGTMIAVMSEDQTKARLVRVKNSLGLKGGGIDYTIEPHVVTNDGEARIETSRIKWGSFVPGPAQSLLADIDGDRSRGRPAARTDQAESFLERILSAGPMPRASVIELGAQEVPAIAERTLDRAAKSLSIKNTSNGWALPKFMQVLATAK